MKSTAQPASCTFNTLLARTTPATAMSSRVRRAEKMLWKKTTSWNRAPPPRSLSAASVLQHPINHYPFLLPASTFTTQSTPVPMGGYRCPVRRCEAHLFQKKADLSEHLKDDHEWTPTERRSYLKDAEEESDGSSNDYTRTYNDTSSSSSSDDQDGGSKKRGGGDGSYRLVEHKDDGSSKVLGYGPKGRNVVYNDDGKKAGKGK